MKQNKKTETTKLKIGILITLIAISTSCATNNQHKKISLRIIKNNNVILEQIKNERTSEKLLPKIKKKYELLKAETR